ncbi:MAG: class IV adenylate cyclase [Euryarchaeota archaeon]|nr:class IV adenylate cyclase [Euryarchaeota archaeon]
MLEVEVKAPAPDLRLLARRLRALGFRPWRTEKHTDTYYRHPSRDYAQTDEALRIRRLRGDPRAWLTYKGPKIDRTTKSRREIEVALAPGQDPESLLESLGFRPAARLHKHRALYKRGPIVASLDRVQGLGTYLELEIHTHPARYPAEKRRLLRLFHQLGIEQTQRKSYLEMQMEKNSGRRSKTR